MLAVVPVHAVQRARAIQTEIPWVGMDGIPIRDEIGQEMTL